ncbi:MAG TPA: GvpL/GvpF family gas vesicle protein [Bacillota bacterium]|nr:GvpL/GvpF family gas vesicle protein [Bacillota bacterium]
MKLSKGLYAFCFIRYNEADRGVKPPGETFLVGYRDIAAVVSNVPKSSWQPTRKNIQKHQKIISRVQENYELLPLRFGTVFKDNEEVRKILEDSYPEIRNMLNKISGKVELGLRVFWVHEAFLREVGNRKVEELKKEFELGRKDRYMIAVEAGKIIEAAVLKKRDEYVRIIFKPLSRLADDSILNPVTGEKMVFNAAFLVKKQLIADFDKAVCDLADEYRCKFSFRYSGPWPPYNFVTVSW